VTIYVINIFYVYSHILERMIVLFLILCDLNFFPKLYEQLTVTKKILHFFTKVQVENKWPFFLHKKHFFLLISVTCFLTRVQSFL